MREVQANKNIIANRRRALDTILKLNTTHGYSSNMLIQHNFNKNTVPPIWGVIHTLSLGDVLALSDYSSPQAVRVLNRQHYAAIVHYFQTLDSCLSVGAVNSTIKHYI